MGTIYRVGIAAIVHFLATIKSISACDNKTMTDCDQKYGEGIAKIYITGNSINETKKHGCELFDVIQKCLTLAKRENCTDAIKLYRDASDSHASFAAACSSHSAQCNLLLIAKCLEGVPQLPVGQDQDAEETAATSSTTDFGLAINIVCENTAKAKTCIANRSKGCTMEVVSYYLGNLDIIDNLYCSCNLNSVYECQKNVRSEYNISAYTQDFNTIQDLAMKAVCKLHQGMNICRHMADRCPYLVKQSLTINTTMLPYDCNKTEAAKCLGKLGEFCDELARNQSRKSNAVERSQSNSAHGGMVILQMVAAIALCFPA